MTQLHNGFLSNLSIGIDAEDNQYIYGRNNNGYIYRLIVKKGEDPKSKNYVRGQKSIWTILKGRSQCVSVAKPKDGTQHLWCVGMDTNPYQVTVTDKNSTTKKVIGRGEQEIS